MILSVDLGHERYDLFSEHIVRLYFDKIQESGGIYLTDGTIIPLNSKDYLNLLDILKGYYNKVADDENTDIG